VSKLILVNPYTGISAYIGACHDITGRRKKIVQQFQLAMAGNKATRARVIHRSIYIIFKTTIAIT